ncbi:MAG: GNAT family N-acetyltransferase [Lentilactobacillus diolivorans]|uniref:GNAT family N-acetyltransferase n=1 Tax=Lentilactobacillus diolivorans TaxID=179838 RepID=UPI0039ED1651
MITHVNQLSGPDLERVAQIWLKANLEAHSFIDPKYWLENFESVKSQLAVSELFIFRSDNQITGFLGMDHGYIAGLFVAAQFRGQGVGSALIKAAQSANQELTLSVYLKNQQARRFYVHQGFTEITRKIDEATGELTIDMKWPR